MKSIVECKQRIAKWRFVKIRSIWVGRFDCRRCWTATFAGQQGRPLDSGISGRTNGRDPQRSISGIIILKSVGPVNFVGRFQDDVNQNDFSVVISRMIVRRCWSPFV